MSIATTVFRRPDYESDTTMFIAQLKAAKPTLEAEQRAGRALLWDKNIDRNAHADISEGNVAQTAYVYQTKSSD
jgi:hypothetical protein